MLYEQILKCRKAKIPHDWTPQIEIIARLKEELVTIRPLFNVEYGTPWGLVLIKVGSRKICVIDLDYSNQHFWLTATLDGFREPGRVIEPDQFSVAVDNFELFLTTLAHKLARYI